MKKTQKEIENCLASELSNMLDENTLIEFIDEDILRYFSKFLLGAEVDSKIVVNVLEREDFGEVGKEAARAIKVNEGW